MVRYYGRARQRTGSVNTNQPGLKQAGCPSTVGKQGKIVRFLGRRVNCNLKTCGGPMSGLRCMYNVRDAIGADKTYADIQNSNNPAIKNYCNQVINKLNGTYCQWPQPKNRQMAGGVGNIWTPRRNNCQKTCSLGWQEKQQQAYPTAALGSPGTTGAFGTAPPLHPGTAFWQNVGVHAGCLPIVLSNSCSIVMNNHPDVIYSIGGNTLSEGARPNDKRFPTFRGGCVNPTNAVLCLNIYNPVNVALRLQQTPPGTPPAPQWQSPNTFWFSQNYPDETYKVGCTVPVLDTTKTGPVCSVPVPPPMLVARCFHGCCTIGGAGPAWAKSRTTTKNEFIYAAGGIVCAGSCVDGHPWPQMSMTDSMERYSPQLVDAWYDNDGESGDMKMPRARAAFGMVGLTRHDMGGIIFAMGGYPTTWNDSPGAITDDRLQAVGLQGNGVQNYQYTNINDSTSSFSPPGNINSCGYIGGPSSAISNPNSVIHVNQPHAIGTTDVDVYFDGAGGNAPLPQGWVDAAVEPTGSVALKMIQAAQLPSARAEFTATVHRAHIYCIGGIDCSGIPTNTVDIFDVPGMKWFTPPPPKMTWKRSRHCAVAPVVGKFVGGNEEEAIYVVGGGPNDIYSNSITTNNGQCSGHQLTAPSIEKFLVGADTSHSGTWTDVNSLPNPALKPCPLCKSEDAPESATLLALCGDCDEISDTCGLVPGGCWCGYGASPTTTQNWWGASMSLNMNVDWSADDPYQSIHSVSMISIGGNHTIYPANTKTDTGLYSFSKIPVLTNCTMVAPNIVPSISQS